MAKVLLVEDESALVATYRLALKNAGHQVIESVESGDAFDKAKTELPQIIFLDLVFACKNGREEVDEISKETGFGILRRLKCDDSTKHIPVVVLTNLGAQSDKRRARELGAVDFIVKASSLPSDLVKLVGQWTK